MFQVAGFGGLLAVGALAGRRGGGFLPERDALAFVDSTESLATHERVCRRRARPLCPGQPTGRRGCGARSPRISRPPCSRSGPVSARLRRRSGPRSRGPGPPSSLIRALAGRLAERSELDCVARVGDLSTIPADGALPLDPLRRRARAHRRRPRRGLEGARSSRARRAAHRPLAGPPVAVLSLRCRDRPPPTLRSREPARARPARREGRMRALSRRPGTALESRQSARVSSEPADRVARSCSGIALSCRSRECSTRSWATASGAACWSSGTRAE